MESYPKNHVELTRRTWKIIREGVSRCRQSEKARTKCLEWCHAIPEYTQTWAEILEGQHEEMVRLVFEFDDYFDLPLEAMAWWERIIQNHPFSVLFAADKYAEILEKRRIARDSEKRA